MAFTLSTDGTYKAQQVELRTITDVTAMKGKVAELFGGARLVLDPQDPLWNINGGSLTEAQVREIVVKGPGGTPRASFVEKDGVLWPFDFHTWGMVSTYYNFENAFAYFEQTGAVPMERLEGANASRIYYFADYEEPGSSLDPLRDNAIFLSLIHAFALLPFDKLQNVPLQMNFGVIAHEFSHRVFNQRVLGEAAVPEPLVRWQGTVEPQINLIKSLDEGLADYHAFGATCLLPFGCDPKFFSRSLPPDDSVGKRRDISRADLCLTEGLRNSLDNKTFEDFKVNQYDVGDIFAAALYQAGAREGKHQVLQKAVLASYFDEAPGSPGFAQLISNNLQTPAAFTLAAVADIVLQHVSDPGLKTQLCNEFQDRLQILKDAMPHCPVGAAGGTKCPRINP